MLQNGRRQADVKLQPATASTLDWSPNLGDLPRTNPLAERCDLSLSASNLVGASTRTLQLQSFSPPPHPAEQSPESSCSYSFRQRHSPPPILTSYMNCLGRQRIRNPARERVTCSCFRGPQCHPPAAAMSLFRAVESEGQHRQPHSSLQSDDLPSELLLATVESAPSCFQIRLDNASPSIRLKMPPLLTWPCSFMTTSASAVHGRLTSLGVRRSNVTGNRRPRPLPRRSSCRSEVRREGCTLACCMSLTAKYVHTRPVKKHIYAQE
jgi:hypothetical protein